MEETQQQAQQIVTHLIANWKTTALGIGIAALEIMQRLKEAGPHPDALTVGIIVLTVVTMSAAKDWGNK